MDFLYLDDDEMPKYICALYYQLHPENAIDIIYTDQIKRYLDNNDSKLPSEKEKIPHFNEILENAITKVSNIPNATLALNSCFKDMMNKEIITIWDTLYNHIKNDIPRNLEEYQKILLTKITDKDNYLKSIINQIYNDENFSINDFYRNITKLIDIKGIDAINKLKSKKVKPVEFIDFIKLAKLDYKQYKIECNEIDLDQYLSTLQIDQIQKLDIIHFIINDLNNKLVHYSAHLY